MSLRYFNDKDDKKVTRFESFFFDVLQKRSIEMPNLEKATAARRADDPFPKIVSLSSIVKKINLYSNCCIKFIIS